MCRSDATTQLWSPTCTSTTRGHLIPIFVSTGMEPPPLDQQVQYSAFSVHIGKLSERLSRQNGHCFQKLPNCSSGGWIDRPHVDLFATAANAQLPVYCTRCYEPLALHTDALSMARDGIATSPWPFIRMPCQWQGTGY